MHDVPYLIHKELQASDTFYDLVWSSGAPLVMVNDNAHMIPGNN